VATLIVPRPFSARDTVAGDTPAAAATSRIVGRTDSTTRTVPLVPPGTAVRTR
jgi:hypothetical protein